MLDFILKLIGVYKLYEKRLDSEIEKGQIPSHVGIILDGNRRWAQNHNIPIELGHAIGANVVEKLLDWCHELKIKSITLYVLSTENLSRPKNEVEEILGLIEARLSKLLNDERIYKYHVRVKEMGKLELLPKSIQTLLQTIEEKTANFDDHYLNIAIAYGGRTEITDVVKSIAEDVERGKLAAKQITQDVIEKRLYTSHLPNPEPELIIRTSGEERLSGFLLWQGAYSELMFIDAFWPDFRKIDLMRAIRTYQKRQRRFGR
jgi:tritrans,polycis-undecaprenyl-diphosphate synthase [geranylgeranyl-diphosphate specific]